MPTKKAPCPLDNPIWVRFISYSHYDGPRNGVLQTENPPTDQTACSLCYFFTVVTVFVSTTSIFGFIIFLSAIHPCSIGGQQAFSYTVRNLTTDGTIIDPSDAFGASISLFFFFVSQTTKEYASNGWTFPINQFDLISKPLIGLKQCIALF